MVLVPFREAGHVVDAFLSLLKKHSINPPVGSQLEDELLSVTHLLDVAKDPSVAVGSKPSEVLCSAAGMYDLAAKILSCREFPEFERYLPHLRLIAKTGVPNARLGQNSKSFDDTARKIAELYLACPVGHLGTEVELDDPDSGGGGDNPDVMFVLDEMEPPRRRKWALAVKTISSRAGQTIFERIADGAGQIDDERCSAEIGMVVINTKNALRHDLFWETEWADVDAAKDTLTKELRDLAEASNKDRPASEWHKVFSGKTVRPVLFLGQTVVRLDTPFSAETPTPLKMLFAYDALGEYCPTALGLVVEMNKLMQTIVQGKPGGNGYMPS